MSKNKIWALPNGQYGTAEPELQKMVKPEYMLMKIFNRKMEPVINDNTGRQLVKFVSKSDMKYWREA